MNVISSKLLGEVCMNYMDVCVRVFTFSLCRFRISTIRYDSK